LNLFVSEKYRGLGIGKMLLFNVLEVCKAENIQQLTLEVRVSNEYALRMYKDLGFTVSHVRKNYYKNNDDAYLMVMDIEVK
jgi:ribosomal-protein-alanine N-acetyltransferase